MNRLKKQDKFEEKLNEQLNGLEYKPSDALWNRIEQNLDTDTFEPAIREKLESFTIEPTEKVWAEIETQLPETKKRKGIFWLSLITLILGIGFWAGYLFNTYVKTPDENKKAISIQSNKAAKSTILQPLENAYHTRQNKNLTPSTTFNTKEKNDFQNKKDIKDASELSPEKANNIHHNTTQKNKSASLNKQAYISHNTSISNVLNVLSISEDQAVNKTTANFSLMKKTIPITPKSTSSQSQIIEPKMNANPEIPVSDIVQQNSSQHKTEVSIPSTVATESKKANELTPISTIDKPATEPSTDPDSQKNPKDTFSENPAVRTNDYGDPELQLSNISVTATIGAQMCYMSLSMPANDPYQLEKSYQLRKTLEKPGLDYNGGFFLNYHLNTKWTISSGIQITSFRQIVNYSLGMPVDTTHNLVQPQSQYISPKDSILTGTTNVLENKYSFTEIPLLFTYNFHNGATFDIDLQAGVSYAFLNLVSAYIPDPSCVGLLNVSDKNDFPKMKNLIFVSLAPSIGFKVNNTVTIGVLPFVKLSVNSMVDNDKWIQQRPWLVGANIFFRKRF